MLLFSQHFVLQAGLAVDYKKAAIHYLKASNAKHAEVREFSQGARCRYRSLRHILGYRENLFVGGWVLIGRCVLCVLLLVAVDVVVLSLMMCSLPGCINFPTPRQRRRVCVRSVLSLHGRGVWHTPTHSTVLRTALSQVLHMLVLLLCKHTRANYGDVLQYTLTT